MLGRVCQPRLMIESWKVWKRVEALREAEELQINNVWRGYCQCRCVLRWKGQCRIWVLPSTSSVNRTRTSRHERHWYRATISVCPSLRNIMTGVNVRQHRDMKDTDTLLLSLSAHLSGTSWRESMRTAMLIGQTMVDSTSGNTNAQFIYRRSYQAVTLQSRSSLRVDGERVHVDQNLVSQRLIVASNAIDDRKALFRFE